MILQRYIFRQLVVMFLSLFVVCMAVCLVGMTFKLFRHIQVIDIEWLGRMSILAAGYVAPLVLVFSCCPATTLVYGRLAAENEIDAMRMTGLHANRFLAPAVLFGILLVVAAYVILEYANPAARNGQRKARRETALFLLKLPSSGKNLRIRLGRYYLLSYMDYRDGRMMGIDLTRRGPDGLEEEYQAVSGYAVIEEGEVPRIYLSKPSITRYTEGREVRLTWENDYPIPLDIGDLSGGPKRPEGLTREELKTALIHERNPRKRSEIQTIYYTRFAQSLAPLLLVLSSVPVGVFVKKASRLAGLGAALPPLLIYLVTFFVCKGMGEKGLLDPFVAAFLPDAVLAVMATVLLSLVYRK